MLRIPAVSRVLALGLLIRIPLWAANTVITLHVLGHLDRSYVEAGAVSTAVALGLAVSNPWRGRRLDRVGLRATVLPSIVVGAVVWSVAPWLGYWPLVVLAAVASLFAVPSFSIIRQVLISHTSDEQRTAVLSIDAVAAEATFLVGPVLGVLAATYLPTPVALLLCQLGVVGGAIVLWIADPPLRGRDAAGHDPVGIPVRGWLTPAVVAVLAVSLTTTVILAGEDLSTVAALRSWGQITSVGWVLALLGASSAIGGLVYGALQRHPSSASMLACLGASTALVAVAPDGHRLVFVVLLTCSGLFCAPTITATVDDLSRSVPAGVRGEAMGWHGSALTLGSALGAPLIGISLDAGGWVRGFVASGAIGLTVALAGLLVIRLRAAPSAPAAVEDASEAVPGSRS